MAADQAAVTPVIPARRRWRPTWRRLPFWLELVTIVAGYEAYALVRLAVRASRPTALAHAAQLWRAEGWLHVRIEPWLNHALSAHPLLADAAGYYYGLAHFVVTGAVLLLLYLRRPEIFPRLRSGLVLSTMAANVVFWLWPAAPPRLAVPGLDDTLVTGHILSAADPHGVTSLADLYATMPSLHVAWATWCALAAALALRSRWRHLAWLYPAATTLVVLATANHFVLDVVAGGALAILGVACAGGLRRPVAGALRLASAPRDRQLVLAGPAEGRAGQLPPAPATAAASVAAKEKIMGQTPPTGRAGRHEPGADREVRLPASGWCVSWRHPEGRTVIEVRDAAGVLTGLVASSSLPLVSVDGGWRGTGPRPGGGRQCWALAMGHAVGPVAVTFARRRPGSRRTRRLTVHPAVVDGLWVAAVTGPCTTAQCSSSAALRLAPAPTRTGNGIPVKPAASR